MINRFSYGYTPSLQKATGRAGGPREWFDAQLNPSRIADQNADAMKAWFPYLRSSSPPGSRPTAMASAANGNCPRI